MNNLEEEMEGEEVQIPGVLGSEEMERRSHLDDKNFYNFDDQEEMDELEMLKMDLEPQYQRYAKWKI